MANVKGRKSKRSRSDRKANRQLGEVLRRSLKPIRLGKEMHPMESPLSTGDLVLFFPKDRFPVVVVRVSNDDVSTRHYRTKSGFKAVLKMVNVEYIYEFSNRGGKASLWYRHTFSAFHRQEKPVELAGEVSNEM